MGGQASKDARMQAYYAYNNLDNVIDYAEHMEVSRLHSDSHMTQKKPLGDANLVPSFGMAGIRELEPRVNDNEYLRRLRREYINRGGNADWGGEDGTGFVKHKKRGKWILHSSAASTSVSPSDDTASTMSRSSSKTTRTWRRIHRGNRFRKISEEVARPEIRLVQSPVDDSYGAFFDFEKKLNHTSPGGYDRAISPIHHTNMQHHHSQGFGFERSESALSNRF